MVDAVIFIPLIIVAVTQMVKMAFPPALTLTFFFKQDGEVERLNIQDFNRENNKER